MNSPVSPVAIFAQSLVERLRGKSSEFFAPDVIAWAHTLDATGIAEARGILKQIAPYEEVLDDWWRHVEGCRPRAAQSSAVAYPRPNACRVTVLFCDTSRNHSAAKTWRRGENGPTPVGFSAGAFFAFRTYPVANIRELVNLVSWVIPQGNAFLTRYEPVPGLDLQQWHRRRARTRPDVPATLRERPDGLPWITLDIDGLSLPFDADPARDPEAVIRYVVSRLPSCFQGVTVCWTLTSSAGMSKNPRVVSLRLFFWLDRPLVDEDATTWVETFAIEVDPAVFHPAQAIYVAAPRFEDGLVDPIPRRCGLLEGRVEHVAVPPIPVKVSHSPSGFVQGQSVAKTFEDWMRELGDGPGLSGFYRPLLNGTWAYVASGRRDFDRLKAEIRTLAAQAPRKESRSEDTVEGYLSDETLDDYIEGAIEKLSETKEPVERERLEALAKAWKGRRSNEGVAERGRVLGLILSGMRVDAEQAKNVARGLGVAYQTADPASLAEHFDRSLTNGVTVNMIAREIEKAQTRLRVVKNPNDWTAKLRKGTVGFGESERQVVLPTVENLMTIVAEHPAWSGKIIFDEFLNAASVIGSAPWHPTTRPTDAQPGPWSDEDNTRLVGWIGREIGVTFTDALVYKAVLAHAQTDKRHPIRDWLQGLRHDGQERLGTWLVDYLGVEDTEYARDVGWWFAIGAVARIFRPGCKLDTMLVLEGPQGKYKSTALKALFGPDFVRDTPLDFMTKDRFIQLQGVWCYEVAELDGMDRTETDRVKSFLSSADDAYRPPYGRSTVKIPRRLVFAGTVNRDDYLRDETGNRRFLPVKCQGEIDIKGLEAARDQLWAEAVRAFRDGFVWWPDTAEEKACVTEEQAQRLQRDVWVDEIQTYLTSTKREWTTVGDCLFYALGLTEKAKWTRGEQMRVSRALTILGWERRHVRDDDKQTWRYYSKDILPS